jgi:hypothetical protein
MTRRIYLSFLGAGNYEPTRYVLRERGPARRTRYVQVAELELVGPFDAVIVLATETSWAKHGEALLEEVRAVTGAEPHHLLLSEELDVEAQWASFEQVLGVVQDRDRVVFDFTHGYRSVPIILSAALEFLRRARDIEIESVLYGAYEKGRDAAGSDEADSQSPIIDMRDFYAIGAWTDAVARLVDDADARALTALAERDEAGRFGALASPELRRALDAFTDAIRNVDVPRVETRAREALAAVKRARASSDLPSGVLLGLVGEKLESLVVEAPLGGRFDLDFFRCQIALARLLVEHRLFMQAFTVLREHIASLGMRAVPKAGLSSGEQRKPRERYGEVFWQMVLREDFEARPDTLERHRVLAPWFEALASAGLVDELREVARGLDRIRNGLNHAWMSTKTPDPEMETKARGWIDALERISHAAFALELPEAASAPAARPPLINVSNHPSASWSQDQVSAAEVELGGVVDLEGGFPPVPPESDAKDIERLAEATASRIRAQDPSGAAPVFVAGELRLTVALVARLQREGRRCVTTAAARDVTERGLADGTSERTSRFRFVRWADYPPIHG